MKTKLTATIMSTVFTILSAGSFPVAAQTTSPKNQPNYDLEREVDEVRKMINHDLSASSCEARLGTLNDFVAKLTPESFDTIKAKQNAKSIIKKLFLARLDLQRELKEMSQNGAVSTGCESNIRRSFIISRLFEEYLAKMAGFEADVDVLKGEEPYLMINPKFGKKFKLESGDVLISRGNAIVSAAIAQIGDVDGHFSHAAIAYVDESTGKTYMVEAHIEIGTDVKLFEKSYANDGKVRSIVYRPSNRELAKKAGLAAYEAATNALKNRKPVPYDFGMVLGDESELFCSEIPHFAYAKASQSAFSLGSLYQTTFTPRNRNFLDGIGVKVNRTYAPSDVELDTNLELVAEWRDLGRAHQTHRKDAIINRIYKWMEEENLNFDLSKTKPKAMLIRLLRQMPLLNIPLKSSVASNITTKALQTMLVLTHVGDHMLDDLIAFYETEMKRTGRQMTYPEMLEAMDTLRAVDTQRLKLYSHWKSENPVCNSESPCYNEPEAPHFMDYFKFEQ